MKSFKRLSRIFFLMSLMLAAFFAIGITVSAAAEGGQPMDIGPGFAYLGAGLSTGIAAIGGGIAVGGGAPAAIGALTEDPKSFGKSLIFVALGEGIALYGMLISILILNKV